MRLIVAVLKPSQVEVVRQSLAGVHVTRLTICDAQGYDSSPSARGEFHESLVQQSVMEIAVNDDFVDRTVGMITAALGCDGGDLGEWLFVMPIDDAVQIYRDVRGPEAV